MEEKQTEEIYEYELIDIIFEQTYDMSEEELVWSVHEDEPNPTAENQKSLIVFDEDGVPIGDTPEETDLRRAIMHEHIQKWRAEHTESPYMYNEALKENVKINQVFLLESMAHACIKYRSTKAVLKMEEVIRRATPIGDARKKEGTNNQTPFQHMVVLIYRSRDLGNVKMTVGVRIRTHEKVMYSITAPEPGKAFIDDKLRMDKGPKKRKKHRK